MNYEEKFEDDRFVYELNIRPADEKRSHLYTCSQGDGYFGQWNIIRKATNQNSMVNVTDDDCEIIVYHSIEAAVKGSKEFLLM